MNDTTAAATPNALHTNDLTVEQVAAQEKVHPNTVRRWVRTGQVEAYRIGPKLIRIRAASIQNRITPA